MKHVISQERIFIFKRTFNMYLNKNLKDVRSENKLKSYEWCVKNETRP